MTERRVLYLVLGGLTLIGLVSVGSWFLTNFERRTHRVPVRASAEVRRNPLFAAQLLFERLGIPAESVPGRGTLRHLPPTTDTVLARGLGALDADRRTALSAWMAAGGHLVVDAADPWEETERSGDFLDEHGVRARLEDADHPGRGEILAQVWLDSGVEPLSVAVQADRYLESESTDAWVLWAGGRLRAVRLPVGEGALTVLSDTRFMTNAQIGHNDHALFAAHLLRPRHGGKVWLLYGREAPWLGEILWETAPLALVSGAWLILAWAWSLGARLGPLEPPPDRRRRDLREHLDAVGDFLWRHGGASYLVTATRGRVRGAWERHRAELRQLTPRGQLAEIAAAARQSADLVDDALLQQADGPRAFIRQAQRLQLLWRVARPARRGGISAPAQTRP